MSKTAPFLLALLYCFSSLAQTPDVIERVNQRTDRVSLLDVKSNVNKSWLISGQANPGTNITAPLYFIQSVDSTGSINWDYGHGLMPSTWDAALPTDRDKLILLSDGSAVLVGLQDACDVFSGISYLIKLTPSGTVEWSHEFGTADEYDPELTYDRLATNATSHIAIASFDTIRCYDSQGDLLTKWQVEDAPVRCMRWETDSTLLVAAASKVLRFGTDGSLFDSVSLPNNGSGIDIHTSDDRIWILTQNSIEVINDQFQIISTIDLATLSGSALHFQEVDGAVWITDGTGLWSISAQYDLVNELMFLDQVAAVAIQDSTVMTVSTVAQNNRTSGLMKSYLLDGTSIEHSDDVELIVTLDSVVVNSSFNYVPIFSLRAYVSPSIINHSANLVQKVMVSYTIQYAPGFCGIPGVSVITENMVLGFQDTIVIPFPSLDVGLGPFSGDSVVQASVCLEAQSPNDHLDIFPSDNIWCKDLEFVLPLGVQNLRANTLTVYPNPTTGIVNLPQIENLKWELFDATGRSVAEGNGNTPIHLTQLGLSEQIYILQMITDEIQSSTKLVYLRQ